MIAAPDRRPFFSKYNGRLIRASQQLRFCRGRFFLLTSMYFLSGKRLRLGHHKACLSPKRLRGNAICVSGDIAERRECWFSIGSTRGNRKPSEFRARYHRASWARGDSHGGPLKTRGISMIPKVTAHESGGGQRVPSVFLTVSFAQKACFPRF